MAKRTAAERFWAKVERDGLDDCWLWTANTTGASGYGLFYDGATTIVAHRFSYQEAKGPIPDGLVIDHICRVRLCVNPEHLTPRTNRENVLIGIGPTAVNAAKTVCIRGHEFATRPNGSRYCPTCVRETKRRSQAKRMADPEHRERRRAQERARYVERYARRREVILAQRRERYRRKGMVDDQ